MLSRICNRGFPEDKLEKIPEPKIKRDENGFYIVSISEGVKVYLDDYYIDIYEVSQERYKACLEAGGCELTPGTGELLNRPVWDQHPMMDITWYDAQEYCEWRGGSLPTEAQWEKAARGTDGRRYPWGDEPVTCERARYGDCGWMTAPVGSHPAGVSPYGVHDMAGNAWEFIYDWYDQDYYQVSPSENPTGPGEDTGWVVP